MKGFQVGIQFPILLLYLYWLLHSFCIGVSAFVSYTCVYNNMKKLMHGIFHEIPQIQHATEHLLILEVHVSVFLCVSVFVCEHADMCVAKQWDEKGKCDVIGTSGRQKELNFQYSS